MHIPPATWLMVSVACFLLSCWYAYVIWSRRGGSDAKPSTAKVAASAVALLVLAGLSLAKWHFQPLPTENEKAAAHIQHILMTDEIARLDSLQDSGVQRGELDTKPDWTKRQERTQIADAELAAARRMITALTEADLDKLREIVASYKFKPYARAQIAEALNYTFYLAKIEYRFSFHERWFYIQPSGLANNNFIIVLSALNEEPEVLMMKESQENPGQFHSNPNEAANPREVLKMFQQDIVRRAR